MAVYPWYSTAGGNTDDVSDLRMHEENNDAVILTCHRS